MPGSTTKSSKSSTMARNTTKHSRKAEMVWKKKQDISSDDAGHDDSSAINSIPATQPDTMPPASTLNVSVEAFAESPPKQAAVLTSSIIDDKTKAHKPNAMNSIRVADTVPSTPNAKVRVAMECSPQKEPAKQDEGVCKIGSNSNHDGRGSKPGDMNRTSVAEVFSLKRASSADIGCIAGFCGNICASQRRGRDLGKQHTLAQEHFNQKRVFDKQAITFSEFEVKFGHNPPCKEVLYQIWCGLPAEELPVRGVADQTRDDEQDAGPMCDHVDVDLWKRFRKPHGEAGVLPKGGHSIVYKARDGSCKNKEVAIKMMTIDGKMYRERSKKIRREIKIMKKLIHPNICKLYSSYQLPGTPVAKQTVQIYLVLEFCSGGDLLTRIMSQKRLPEATASDILWQMANALKFAHDRGVVHRDVKPENVVFVSETDIKLIDWGVSALLCDEIPNVAPLIERTGSADGTPAYKAPEVQDKDVGSYTSACDLWSLGTLIYAMLSGHTPFVSDENANYQKQLQQKKAERIPMCEASEPWKSTSAEAKGLIKSLLKARPEERLNIIDVLRHPWLTGVREARQADPGAVRKALENMRQFIKSARFFALCAILIARHLDHDELREIHGVFVQLDTNHDGVLQLEEIEDGFKNAFGDGSQEYREASNIFKMLDVDKSGSLDWLEFCAAAISPEKFLENEEALFAAFKEFDEDDDGSISEAEFLSVLRSCKYINKDWCNETAKQAAAECLQGFDHNGDRQIDFAKWGKLVRDLASQPTPGGSITRSPMHKVFPDPANSDT
mmetsp:Transcript_133666/g.250068  ORF Transcript_133666/g.250068 Transcript_133666/m.250068 type:complete len:784 (-) Transcript_133666:72-2423(-)